MPFAIAMSIAIVASILGDFLMKQAASPELVEAGATAARLHRVRTFRFAAGITMLTIHFIAFMAALKLAAVSVVIPLMSCTYVGTTLLARVALRENVPALRWAGIGVIMLGVLLLFRST